MYPYTIILRNPQTGKKICGIFKVEDPEKAAEIAEEAFNLYKKAGYEISSCTLVGERMKENKIYFFRECSELYTHD